jgi:hypothetical protein
MNYVIEIARAAEWRYVVEPDDDGTWMIRDRFGPKEGYYGIVAIDIETREEAEEVRGKLIRGLR